MVSAREVQRRLRAARPKKCGYTGRILPHSMNLPGTPARRQRSQGLAGSEFGAPEASLNMHVPVFLLAQPQFNLY